MDYREEYRSNMSSPRSYENSQWNPPSRTHNTAQGSPQTYSPPPHSPPQASSSLHEYQAHDHPDQHHVPHAIYQEGYSTEKEAPAYATNEISSAQTPDYSGPQVVPGQFYQYPQTGRPFSPLSDGGATLTSPQVRPYSFKEHINLDDQPAFGASSILPKNDRKFGMKKRTFYIIFVSGLALLLALALGLSLGLVLGLRRSKNSNPKTDAFCRQKPEYCIGGSLNANYFSKKGAYNGTGIALAGESWNVGQRRIFTLYFQHNTGDIRYMQYTTDKKWVGGTKAQTVATDAKNASPISAVSVGLNTTQYFHIFYIDKNNTIKQVTKSNISDIWQPGPLSDLNLKAMDSPSSGLQACWKGSYYGDSDYTKFPTASGQPNTRPFGDPQLQGMNIWYAVDETTFQQYAWYSDQSVWMPIQRWSGFNAHAGVGCYSWGEGTTTYAMMANQNNDVEFWWKDTNTTLKSSEKHPVNSWQNASNGAISGVNPITSLGYTTYFYAQMKDGSIKGYNVTYQAENTTFVQDQAFTITDPAGPALGLGGTHMTLTAYAEKDENTTKWDSLYVFYQTVGDDITAFTRPIAGGEWTRGILTIPDD